VRAAVYQPGGAVVLEERDVPAPGPGEVLVAMRACGICGSDLMRWYVEPRAPLVLGHEPVGEVVAAGEAVEAPLPEVGARVFVHHHVPCGECELCRRGRDTLCETFKATRIHPGGFSERILVPAENAARDLLVVPETVSDAAATLIEPLACCVRGLRRAKVGRETRLLVIGGGQMGLLTALGGLAAGAKVAVAEPLAARRDLAEDLGASTIDPLATASDAPQGAASAATAHAIASALGGRPTVVMLATGAAAAWELAISAADKGAVVQLFAPSGPGESRAFEVDDVFFRELELQASYSAGPHDTRFALQLIAGGAVPAERLVTHRFPLERTEEALAAARSREGVKVIVTSSA
jgi:L-iditol 2-dehydrogenase